MTAELDRAIAALDRRFMLDFPRLAAARIERLPRKQTAAALSEHEPTTLAPVMALIAPDVAMELVDEFTPELAAALLSEVPPNIACRILGIFSLQRRTELLQRIDPSIAGEISSLMEYPVNSSGQLMETRVIHFREDSTVEQTLERLRGARIKSSRSIFVVDADNKLCGRVTLQDLALAAPATMLSEHVIPVSAVVNPMASRDEVVELLEKHKLVDLAVVDVEGRLLGIIYHGM
ncbi:MAG TPA: CBS domain-containing protein, partial [Gammaproteobacteria bacterium]|nr:CBS domain-containing protein [Gammaproteobacteria bacterium]